MKTYKELLNDVVNHSKLRKPTIEEAKAIKACTLEFFDKLQNLCKQNHLSLFMGGGSALGTVRHKGFIPWDDDMDLMMARPEYDRLIELLEEGALGDNYEFTYPNKKKDSPFTWLKIYQKDTLMVDINGVYPNYPNGLAIDVFPIEGVPANKIIRQIKGTLSNSLRLIANMVFNAELQDNSILQQLYNQDKRLKRMMRIRKLLGHLFLLIMSHRRWVYLFDVFAKDSDMNSFVGVPTGRKLYMGESQPAEVFFPPRKGLFEGREVLVPANVEQYLTSLYGDYMWIPQEEKRESHLLVDIKIPERYYCKE